MRFGYEITEHQVFVGEYECEDESEMDRWLEDRGYYYVNDPSQEWEDIDRWEIDG
jgi:hypothetical protein